jgi:hypothetical protein
MITFLLILILIAILFGPIGLLVLGVISAGLLLKYGLIILLIVVIYLVVKAASG